MNSIELMMYQLYQPLFTTGRCGWKILLENSMSPSAVLGSLPPRSLQWESCEAEALLEGGVR